MDGFGFCSQGMLSTDCNFKNPHLPLPLDFLVHSVVVGASLATAAFTMSVMVACSSSMVEKVGVGVGLEAQIRCVWGLVQSREKCPGWLQL